MTERMEAYSAAALESKTAGESGAEILGVPPIDGLTGPAGDRLYAVLRAIERRLGLAVSKPREVSSEADMLALDAGVGDIAIVSASSRSHILGAEPASIFDNWHELVAAATPATPQTLLLDQFAGSTLDGSLWSMSDRPFGRGQLSSSNVSVTGGYLRLRTPAGTFDGAEIASLTSVHRYGSYTARIKSCPGVGSLTSLFLYVPPDFYSEVDVEIIGGPEPRVDLGAYGAGAHPYRSVYLPFDPSADFHDYRFDYAPDSISFYVDGRLCYFVDKSVPQGEMQLMCNLWWPTWIPNAVAPSTNVFAFYEFIEKKSLPYPDTTRPHGSSHAPDGHDPIDAKEIGAQRAGVRGLPANQDHTLTINDPHTIAFYEPPLTAPRNVVLKRPPNSAGLSAQQGFRILREVDSAAGGPYPLRVWDNAVGGTLLREIPAGQWADFACGGSTWLLAASGWIYS